jgi:hypothetical protein
MFSGMVSLLIDKHSLYDHLKVRYLRQIEQEEAKPSGVDL